MPVLFEEETATDTTSTTSSEDEGRSSSRKRPRKQYNIKVKGNGTYAIGPKARIVENHSLTDVCRSSLENFNAFLKTVEASRGPEDQIECSVLTEILPFVESNHIRKGGGCNDSLEILAKLGSPTLKRPRIAKHVLKLLNKLVFMDIGRGITNAGLVETHRCLSQSIADGSLSGELCHDQRRRAEVYCNVLVAMTIGRARGHFAYPQSETDKKEIELCITGTEKILRCWSLPRKYRKRLSLEMILSLLKRSLKRTSIHERLKQLLDRCELMIEDAFVEEDVSFLLNEVRCAEHGQLDLFIIAKMLHAKMKNQPSTKAYQIFKNITTNHALFSPSWTMKRERYDWHFVLLACQIFLDVTTNHNVKATRLDAAEMLTSFRDIKAYAKSMVVCNIVEKYITKATFAFDVESRQYLMAKRHEDEEKISLDLLRKQICAVHATGYLEIVEKICQTENHMLMRGTFLDKPVAVKAKSISYSRLVASHNDKVYATERFIENQTSIWRYLSREANVHVPLLHADDTNKFPNHYIMEYAENGDLRRYLLSRRERNTPSYREALQICLASAKSIYFVHQKHVVHNHLRAEHLLVGSNHHCIKVSGFSRARRQSSKIEFEKEFKVEILNSDDPSIRWTAPWGLQNDGALCCSRSDIWAFGVVMYEIITCGGLPYADKSLEKVRNDVLAGLNLSKEQHVKDGYYSIMQRCFGTESISFSQICSELQKLIDQCAVEDDRPMVIPENISTVYKPINEEVQQNSTQEFCKPFPANKTIENLSTVYKPINEVVQQNRRPFPVNETQSKSRFEIRQAILQDESIHHVKKLTALCHPHLVEILKVQKKLNNASVISYEHFSGQRLGDHIRSKPCTVDDLISLCAQICSAMCYLHSKDIVLCILTMNNAIVLNGRHVKLMGLQNTRSLPTSHGSTSSPICTARVDVQQYLYRWYPPEVIQEGVFSKESDIWSFGMLMWVILSSLDELYDKQDLKPFPLYKDSEILGKLKCNSRPFQTAKCPDWMYVLMTQCWLYNANERASSESILECLTVRCPWESSILQNWLERHEVCENWPVLNVDNNVKQNSGGQLTAPTRGDVMESLSEDFFGEHNYHYAQPSWSIRRTLKRLGNHILSIVPRMKTSSKVQKTPPTVPYSRASSITSMPAPALPDEVVHVKFQERCYDHKEGPMQINGNKSKGIIFDQQSDEDDDKYQIPCQSFDKAHYANLCKPTEICQEEGMLIDKNKSKEIIYEQCDEDIDKYQLPCESLEKPHYANLGKPTESCEEEAMLIDRNKSKGIIYEQCNEDEHIYQIPFESFEKPHYANLGKPTESCKEEGMLIDENKSKEIIYEQCDEEGVYQIPCLENLHYANLGKPTESCHQKFITNSRDSSITPYACSRPCIARCSLSAELQMENLLTVSESSIQEPPSEASIVKQDSDKDRLLYDDVGVYDSVPEPVAAETSLMNDSSDECNMEGENQSIQELSSFQSTCSALGSSEILIGNF